MFSDLALIVGLILLGGLFAGAEIAVLSVRRTRVQELADAGSTAGKALLYLRNHPERFLATVQIAITLCAEATGALAGADLAQPVAQYLAQSPWLESNAHGIAITLLVVVVTFVSLVLGELVPKSLALKTSEGYALGVARPIKALLALLQPIGAALTGASNVVLRPFGDSTNFSESRLSAEELHQLVDEATREGMVDTHAGEIASRALDFGDLTAAGVMVPRNKAVMLSLDMAEVDVRRVVLDSRMHRLPVHEGQPDAILGYVLAHDVLRALVEGRRVDLRRFLRPPLFVPWAMRAGDVLIEMQQRKSQLAIVVDEHGGMAGLLTVEDLVEELVGEIASEFEHEPAALLREAEGAALVLGALPIRDLNRALDVDLPAGDGATTVGGLVSGLYGGIPRRGERVVEPGSGVAFEVVAATRQAVGLVRVLVPERDEGASEAVEGP